MSVSKLYLDTVSRLGSNLEPKFRPILDVERYDFYRPGDKASGHVGWSEPVDWSSFGCYIQYIQALALKQHVHGLARHLSYGLDRGERIDIDINHDYLGLDVDLLRSKLQKIPARHGIQFVTLTEIGVAFIKL